MKTSCINHPSSNRFSLLRQDYWDLCKTNELSQTARACAAKLLNVFEQWMNSRLQNADQIGHYNKAAENEGLQPHTDSETDFWVYESADDLHQALISEHPVKTVRQALSWLVSQNLILRRNNPKFRWDKTYQYRLNVLALQGRIDALNSPKSTHRVSPQGTSTDIQGTSTVPTGESNTIDSFLDSNTDSEREERERSPQKALSELKEESRQEPIGSQPTSLLIQQKDLADDGKISSETVDSAAAIFPPQKNNATANFERRFASPHKYPELVEQGHGDIMVGTGWTDFDPLLIEVALLHLKKHELACEVGDAKRFISNRIKESDWAAIELLKEASAALTRKREETEAAIAASANSTELYDTNLYYVPEAPVVDLVARRAAAEKGIAIMKAARAEAEKKLAS